MTKQEKRELKRVKKQEKAQKYYSFKRKCLVPGLVIIIIAMMYGIFTNVERDPNSSNRSIPASTEEVTQPETTSQTTNTETASEENDKVEEEVESEIVEVIEPEPIVENDDYLDTIDPYWWVSYRTIKSIKEETITSDDAYLSYMDVRALQRLQDPNMFVCETSYGDLILVEDNGEGRITSSGEYYLNLKYMNYQSSTIDASGFIDNMDVYRIATTEDILRENQYYINEYGDRGMYSMDNNYNGEVVTIDTQDITIIDRESWDTYEVFVFTIPNDTTKYGVYVEPDLNDITFNEESQITKFVKLGITDTVQTYNGDYSVQICKFTY